MHARARWSFFPVFRLVDCGWLRYAGQEVDLRTKGRHDPCVGIRGVPVAEAMAALVLADHKLRAAAYG